MIILFNHRKLFFKWNLPIFALIKLKGKTLHFIRSTSLKYKQIEIG